VNGTSTAEPDRPQPSAASPPTKDRVGRGVAVLLALAAAAAALIGGRASLVSSSASGSWQASVRQEVKRSAATVEDVRYVFTVVAPQAVDVVAARIQAEKLRGVGGSRGGLLRELLVQEARVRETFADTFAEANDLVVDRYRVGEGYDVWRFLAATRRANPELLAVDPDEPMAHGDEATSRARRGVAATIPVAGAFLAGALAQGFPGRRRILVVLGFVLLAAGVIGAVLVEVL
jgi:hypothetical protein